MKNGKYKIVLWAFISIFIIIFSYLSVERYRSLNSYYYDLGIMNQTVYNTSQGRLLEMTNQDLRQNLSRFAIHFDPILAVFAPFYIFYPGPEVLLIGQALILGLGAWAVFLLSEKVLKKPFVGLTFALSYIFYFAVERAVLFDFHAVTLATTFLLFAFYFNLAKKHGLYFLFLVLSLLTKEHIGLVVFMLGLYLFFVKKERKIGLWTAALGLVFFSVSVYIIIPWARGGEHFALKYFGDVRSRLGDIVKNGLNYSRLLIRPVIYSLLSPLTLLIALPEWAINALSRNNNQTSFYFHYQSVIVAVLYYSLVLGYRNFNSIVKNKWIRLAVFVVFLFLTYRSAYLYNPIPSSVRYPAKYREVDQAKMESILLWQKNLKGDGIVVATTPKLAPFFTNRRTYINFLYDTAFAEMGLTQQDILAREIDKYTLADYVIINKAEIGGLDRDTLPVKFYRHLRNNHDFEMIFSDDREIEVYKKI